MTRKNKVRRAGKETRVRELAARGLDATQIAKALRQDGVKASRAEVSRFLREEIADRREAAQSVAAADAQASVTLITGSLRELIETGMGICRLAAKAGKSGSADFSRSGQIVIQASRALHAVTTGGETVSGEGLSDELAGVIASRLD